MTMDKEFRPSEHVNDHHKSDIVDVDVDLEQNATDLKVAAPSQSADEASCDDGARDKLPFSRARLLALVFTLTGAAFLNTMSNQAVVIVLPSIGKDLNIPNSRQQWIVSAYALPFGCFLLLWGRIADCFGKRLIFICGSVWLTIWTVVLPFAPNEIAFDIFRALQGLGAAANVPTALGILGVTFPPSKAKNYAFACYGAGAPLGSVVGNILAGVIGQYTSWKWVFWIFSFLAAAVTTAGVFVIPRPPPSLAPRAKPDVDWVGGGIITCGLLALMFALTEGNVVGWSTPWIPALIVVSLILVAAFICWQWYLETKTNRRPLMKVSIWRSLRLRGAMAIMALFFASFSNFLVFTTYFFQEYQGLSVIQTTLRFIPTGVVGLLTAFTTGILLAHIPGMYMLMFGITCIAISSLLFALPIAPNTTYWAYGFPAMVLSVLGADTIYPCLTLFTAHTLPKEDQALGGALINAVAQVGRSLGLAIGTAIEMAVIAKEQGKGVAEVGTLEEVGVGNAALLKGLRTADWFDFGLAVLGFTIAVVTFRGAGKLGAHKR
ncbi:drug resistance protein [Trichodelitschia bisporula]|uniref:Drug resistance protein n=1 Tax=Trichodelitschia bisporula TaxID=703511 RepID=A0A6G1HX51_9PEZI|nr:drug resistance protein [Trichodelitschia bisporula]